MNDFVFLKNKTILITGATGLVGKALIKMLLSINAENSLGLKIIAVSRNKEKFIQRFSDVPYADKLIFIEHDVNNVLKTKYRLNYIVSMASNAHPRLYAADPIGTEMTNIIGTQNMLELAAENPGCRFLLTSSGDIYGDNIYNKGFLKENDCGYINCNTLRAGYIEGKRASEALCNAYSEAKNVDFIIARLCRIYGKEMQVDDSKAISQFIVNAVNKKNLVLKSEGNQVFSYLHVDDVASAILKLLEKGSKGAAYNVSDNEQTISLKDLAKQISAIAGVSVVVDVPDELEKKGASSFANVKLDGSKLKSLGWKPNYTIESGLRKTIEELRTTKC